jgi:hypothetical protein
VTHDTISLDALFDALGVATADRQGRIGIDKNGDVHTIQIDTVGDGSFDLMLAAVQAINENVLDIGQDEGDIVYGSM